MTGVLTSRGEAYRLQTGDLTVKPKERNFQVALVFLMVILSGVLAVIDKAVGILKDRRVRRQTLFKEIIDPLFSETEKIMSNYDVMFTKLLTTIAKGDDLSIRTGLAEFAENRMELKAVRTKVIRVASATLCLPANASSVRVLAAMNKLPPEIREFRSFLFSALEVCTNDLLKSTSSSALQQLRDYVDDPSALKSPEVLKTHIKYAYEDAQKAWGVTCERYVALKFSYALSVDKFF